jgi:hypothetical protein
MSKFIKQRRNILVFNDSITTGVNSFNFNLFCPFQPDEVVITNISITDDQLNVFDTIIVSSSLVDNLNMFAVPNGNASTVTLTTFPINQPINGTFTFNIKYLHSPTTAVQSNITFMLEFIKYSE